MVVELIAHSNITIARDRCGTGRLQVFTESNHLRQSLLKNRSHLYPTEVIAREVEEPEFMLAYRVTLQTVISNSSVRCEYRPASLADYRNPIGIGCAASKMIRMFFEANTRSLENRVQLTIAAVVLVEEEDGRR